MMKKCRFFIIVLLNILCAVSVNAQDQRQYINCFYVKGDVRLPVTVKHRGGQFTIYNNGEKYYGFIDFVEAYDGRGRKIVMPRLSNPGYSTDTSKPIVYEYVFEYLYSDDIGYNNRDDSDNRSHNYGSNLAKAAQWRSQIPLEGYPNVQLQLGASRLYGEFARLKWCAGGEGGFALYGGVGKDWLFDGEFKDKILWHGAMGYYGAFNENADFTIGVSYAQTAQFEDPILGLDGTFSFYFGSSTRFGFFVGGGAGMTSPFGYITGDDPDDVRFTWDANIGIAVKLWTE